MASKTSFAQIDPNIWDDPWFIDLPSDSHRLLFISLFTNRHKNCTGIYEIHKRTICAGFSPELVDEALAIFAESGRIYYEEGYIIIANWMKRTHYNTPEVRTYAINHINSLPSSIKERHSDIIEVILDRAGQGGGQDPAQGGGQGRGQGGNMKYEIGNNNTPISPLSVSEPPEVKAVKAEIDAIRKEAVDIKLICNLTNEQIVKLCEKYGIEKVKVMLSVYYNWKMSTQKKRNDYLTMIRTGSWVEDEANKRMAAGPPPATPRADRPEGWDTWTTEQKREYNLRGAK